MKEAVNQSNGSIACVLFGVVDFAKVVFRNISYFYSLEEYIPARASQRTTARIRWPVVAGTRCQEIWLWHWWESSNSSALSDARCQGVNRYRYGSSPQPNLGQCTAWWCVYPWWRLPCENACDTVPKPHGECATNAIPRNYFLACTRRPEEGVNEKGNVFGLVRTCGVSSC